MSNYSKIRDIIRRMSGQDNVFTVPKIYVEFTGDITTAILLNQIVFLSDKSKRTDGFFYKTYDEWYEEICLTKRQVSYSVKKLKELGLVETKLKRANGAPTVHYKLDYDKLLDSIVTKCHYPSEQNVTNHCDKMSQSLTEITTENTTEIKRTSRKQVYDEDGVHFRLANRLYQRIIENNSNAKKPNLQTWANDMRLMMERDERTEEQIIYLIDWVQRDSFWMSNIMSPKKLREKFDQLVLRVKGERNQSSGKVVKPPNYEIKEGEPNAGRNEQNTGPFGNVQLFK